MKKRYFLISVAFILMISFRINAQLAINADGSPPDNSAMLDVVSTSKGALLPRMSREQIQAIANPANGLWVFCTTNKSYYVFHSGSNAWRQISYGSGRISPCCVCGNDITDERDGQIYHTVLIGNQCWMAQNLNIGVPVDGSGNQENNSIIEKYCYNDFEDNCTSFGGLYQWHEMMQYASTPGIQGICPPGWHIPTDAEWTVLTAYLGGEPVAGGPMKFTDLWQTPNTGATNSSEFSALPAGMKTDYGFDTFTTNAYFWSSTISADTNAYTRRLGYSTAAVTRTVISRLNGSSVRCVK
jgi:uncharacterized protein (TIGR02145 family)